jgi:spore germination cell wall hydrolase CwlJ-like protein
LTQAAPAPIAKTRLLLAGIVVAAILLIAFLAGVGARPHDARPSARAEAGDLSDAALKRMLGRMAPGAQALALRLDPAPHPQLAGRPVGWAVRRVEAAPTLGLRDLTWDDARKVNALLPPVTTPIPPARPFVLHAGAEDRRRAEECLTQAVYYEAGFEPAEGKAAVAQAVLNRLRHPAFPKSVCGVVYQGSQLATGCQFSFTCDGSLGRGAPAPAAWADAQFVARRALNGFVAKAVGEATHYHADYVVPYWRASLVKITQIGAHIFYRWPGLNGEPGAFNGRYAGGEDHLPAGVLTGGGPIALEQALASGQARTVTLAVAGEVRTYHVAAQDVRGGVHTRVAGTITPARPKPTPDQVATINAALAKDAAATGSPAAATMQAPPALTTP